MGYGTDQSLITFKQRHYINNLNLVVLMFSENDFDDNNSTYRYGKSKPRYELHNNIVLTNIPVPENNIWYDNNNIKVRSSSLKEYLNYLGHMIFKSHFINDLYFRLRKKMDMSDQNELNEKDERYILTKLIIKELQSEVTKRKGRLLVIAIPSKREFIKNNTYGPYQSNVQGICNSLNIDYLDLAPYFKKVSFRTYYREGEHWNKYGHKIAALAIYDYLKHKR